MRSIAIALALSMLAAPHAQAKLSLKERTRAIGLRLRNAYLEHKSNRELSRSERRIAGLRAKLGAHELDEPDVHVGIETSTTRRYLASLAQEHRALKNAVPGSRAAKRREMLDEVVGSAGAIKQNHLHRNSEAMAFIALHKNGRSVVSHIGVRVQGSDGHLVNSLAHELQHARDVNADPAGRVSRKRELAQAKEVTQFTGERRAFRKGAFASAVLGYGISGAHTSGGSEAPAHQPDYPTAPEISELSVQGYLIGAKRTIRRAPVFQKLDVDARKEVNAKVNAYLHGFAGSLRDQAYATSFSSAPEGKLARVLRTAREKTQRALGARDQRERAIRSEREAYELGRQDADRDLSATGRTDQLLK